MRNPRFAIHPLHHFLAALLLAITASNPAFAGEVPTAGAPSAADLVKRGAETLQKLKTASAAWRMTLVAPGGQEMLVDVVQTLSMRRMTFTLGNESVAGKELARIVMRDGLWYVSEGDRARKCRPYEFPFGLPSISLLRVQAEPSALDTDQELRANGPVTDGVQVFTAPLSGFSAATRRQLQAAADKLAARSASETSPDIKDEDEVRIGQLRALLAQERRLAVDVATGLLVEGGSGAVRTRFSNFRWLDRVDPAAFDISGREWDDFTDDPTSGDLDSLVLFAFSAEWRQRGDFDTTLFDLKTSRFRRVPFQDGVAVPGCFLRDRSKVAVVGITLGGWGIFEIDLKSGKNRPLVPARPGQVVMEPSLSPDGKTLLVMQSSLASGPREKQMMLIDVATTAARPLGDPLDYADGSWAADGRAVIFRQISRNANAPVADTICRLSLDGQLTRLCQGDSPVPLRDGRILFRQTGADGGVTWKTCAADGKDSRIFADGMSSYAWAAPSPDGKHILMIHHDPDRGNIPFVFNFDASTGKVITDVQGAWTLPAWR